MKAYRSGKSAIELSAQYEISIPCIYRWDKIEEATGSLKPLYKAGDRSIIRDDEQFLRFAEAHSHSTLQQMADSWGDAVSIFAVSRKLRKLGITRKKRHLATSNETR